MIFIKKNKRTLVLLGIAALLFLFYISMADPKEQHRPDSGSPNAWSEAIEKYTGEPEYKSIDRKKQIKDQTSVVRMGGRTFEIPKVFIDSNLSGQIEQPNGINLIYVLPTYSSRVDFKSRQHYELARKQQRFGHMLVEPAQSRPSFDEMIKNRRHSLTKEEYVGMYDELEHFKWFHGLDDQPRLWSEIYIERDVSGKIVSFIDCAPIERVSVRFPGCSHHFYDKGLLYDVFYNKAKYFEQWKAQRDSAIEFIDNFEK